MSYPFECKYCDKRLYIKSDELNIMFCLSLSGSLRKSSSKKPTSNKKGWVPLNVSFENNKISPSKKLTADNSIIADYLKKIKFDEFKKSIINNLNKEPTKIEVVHNLSSLIASLSIASKNENSYYRGYSSFQHELRPSIYFLYSKDYIVSTIKEIENAFIKDFIFRFNDELVQKTLIEKISIMRHFDTPLRIVDVTSNPLVALYFACSESEKLYFGRVDVLDISKEKSIKSTDERFNEWKNIESDIGDLKPPVHVKVATNNQRIIAQKGSFVICDENFNPLSEDIRVIKRLLIVNKKNILNELDKIGINQASLFPDMDHFVEYEKMNIENSYKNQKKGVNDYES